MSAGRPFRLSRRALLRGTGVAMALPLLDAMTPARTRAATAPLRFLVTYAPHGVRMDKWKPSSSGTGWALPPILTPFGEANGLGSNWNQYLSVISGLANYPASIVSGDIFAGAHTRGAGAFLTQSNLATTSQDSAIKNGISIDQVIANHLKALPDRPYLPSLEVAHVEGNEGGNCEDGLSCRYLHHLAWTGETTYLPKVTSPRQVWNKLFGSGTPALPVPGGMTPSPPSTPTDRTPHFERSILDLVSNRAKVLQAKLGKTDRDKLDEYFTSVREIEQRLALLEGSTMTGGGAGGDEFAFECSPGNQPTDPSAYPAKLDLMSDMIVLALACDRTRVVTYMLDDVFSNTNYGAILGGNISSNEYHDKISHHGGSSSNLDKIQQVNTFFTQRVAYLAGKLLRATEGGQSMLDNTVMLFASEFGDPDDHYHFDLPMLVVGKAGGRWKAGQHIVYASKKSTGDKETQRKADKPMANLFLSVLDAFGIPQSTFGHDDTGAAYGTSRLSELEV